MQVSSGESTDSFREGDPPLGSGEPTGAFREGDPPYPRDLSEPKRRSNKKGWAIGAAICLLVMGSCFLSTFNFSARRSEQVIREELLQATPLGSTVDDVDRYAKSRFRQDNFFQCVKTENGKLLMLCYGCYNTLEGFPFATCVQASWQFDEGGKLVRVGVSKWCDCP
jgi:hypothetical protein